MEHMLVKYFDVKQESLQVKSRELLEELIILFDEDDSNDLEVNPLKGKKLTNVRASGTDEAVKLTTPTRMNLEQAISYINDDELVEVTPTNIRLRKVFLNPHERKRNQKIAS